MVVERKIKPKFRKIPPHLIYEEINGLALLYKGFEDVLSGKKKVEAIMGSSSIQSILVYFLVFFIGNKINRKKYLIATNESGLNLGAGNNISNDIAIFEKENVVLTDKYFSKPPKVVIEVDVKIDLAGTQWTTEWDYIIEKSQKMLDFGTEKVIWITTKSKKIFVISPSEKWYLVDFPEDVHLMDDCTLNLAQLFLDEEMVF